MTHVPVSDRYIWLLLKYPQDKSNNELKLNRRSRIRTSKPEWLDPKNEEGLEEEEDGEQVDCKNARCKGGRADFVGLCFHFLCHMGSERAFGQRRQSFQSFMVM